MRLTCQRIVLGMVLALSAAAQNTEDNWLTLEAVTERLSEPNVLRGRYSQTRLIAVLSRPLESSGQFILSERGLYWQQEKPFISTLIADGVRLAQRVADGPLIIIDSAGQPMVLSFSRIFLSIFRGDQGELEDHFSIQFETSYDAWEIVLTPTSYPLSEAINKIMLRGREHIDQLSVFGRSSDEMTINFFDLRTRPEQLTEHEIELYTW